MYSHGPLYTDEQVLSHQLETICNSSVLIQDVARKWWTIEMDGERGPGKSVLAAWHDDDVYIYIYNYIHAFTHRSSTYCNINGHEYPSIGFEKLAQPTQFFTRSWTMPRLFTSLKSSCGQSCCLSLHIVSGQWNVYKCNYGYQVVISSFSPRVHSSTCSLALSLSLSLSLFLSFFLPPVKTQTHIWIQIHLIDKE